LETKNAFGISQHNMETARRAKFRNSGTAKPLSGSSIFFWAVRITHFNPEFNSKDRG